jgi:hypothetical protein
MYFLSNINSFRKAPVIMEQEAIQETKAITPKGSPFKRVYRELNDADYTPRTKCLIQMMHYLDEKLDQFNQ